MYDYGARFYDPSLSLWNSVDPLTAAAPGLTPYRYGFNNPITYNDPNGLFEDKGTAKKFQRKHNICGTIAQDGDIYYIQGSEDNAGQQYAFGSSATGYGSDEKSKLRKNGNSLASWNKQINEPTLGAGTTGRIAGNSMSNYSSSTALSLEADAALAEGKANVRMGVDHLLAVHGEVEGDLLMVEGKAHGGFFTGQRNMHGLFFEGDIGAYVAKGELRGGGSLPLVKWTWEVGGCLGCTSFGARIGLYYNDATNALVFDINEEFGFIIGEQAGLKVEISLPKYNK